MKIHFPAGTLAALGAYGLWGSFPLLFKLVEHVDPGIIVSHRILWSILFVGALLIGLRKFGEVRDAWRDKATLRGILASALLLSGNWLVFVWAVNNGHVLDTSFGYFIVPLVNVGIGMVLLKEKLHGLQLASVILATIAVVVQAIGIGGLPWIALVLAFSFGFYGYFRKTVKVGSAAGLFLEVLLLSPFALLFVLFGTPSSPTPMTPGTYALLALFGPATATPLLLFAYATKRLSMTTIGMFQYLAPTIAFLIAVFIFHEPINAIQLGSFVLIWISIGLFTAGSLVGRKVVEEPV